MKRKLIAVTFIAILILIAATGCKSEGKQTLSILNYDIYMDKSLLSEFEKANNVTIKYDTYSTPTIAPVASSTATCRCDFSNPNQLCSEASI
jgi:spermidine/putrescine-binding protein